MKNLLTFVFLAFNGAVFGQMKVLHYSETSGYDHNTRNESLAMFQSLSTTHGFLVDDDQSGDAFNTLANLQQYGIVVFSNTSGNTILNGTQRANFEAYIANGGSMLGIHAATDTYRHSTANGNNTGSWDFYSELVGASVQENPNHVNGTPQYSMNHIGTHASLDGIPNPWIKNEEYYYWENGFFDSNNTSVLEVEETVGPNNTVNSYDAPRPMSWFRLLPSTGKVYYTALGHAASNFSSDQNFISHIENAILWMLGSSVGIEPRAASASEISIRILPETLEIELNTNPKKVGVSLFNALGQEVITGINLSIIQIHFLTKGLYVLQIKTEKETFVKRVLLY